MKMPPTKLLIFGSPKAGTPLMLAASSIAIDLPLKILIWEDAHGKVWVTNGFLFSAKSREADLRTQAAQQRLMTFENRWRD